MAGSLTDTWEKKVLDYLLRNTSLSLDASNNWIALFTAAPSDSSTGTEVTGGSYARVAINRTGTGWSASSGTTPATSNPAATVTFATATANWGTIVSFGICNSLAGALSTDLMFWGDLSASKVVNNGDTASFAAASLSVTCD